MSEVWDATWKVDFDASSGETTIYAPMSDGTKCEICVIRSAVLREQYARTHARIVAALALANNLADYALAAETVRTGTDLLGIEVGHVCNARGSSCEDLAILLNELVS